MSAIETVARVVWIVVMPIVWWYAVPIIFRWYREPPATFDIFLSRIMAGAGGAVLAFLWPLTAAVYLIGRIVLWRTKETTS